jgi:glycosyltransferase involved in cell wall biosynthesis
VFTAAPDPHAVLESMDGTTLDRGTFGDSDAREHWWFRARMVEQLTARSDRVALLPRDGGARDIERLLGVHLGHPPGRSVVIPEGVHAETVRRAAADVERLADPARSAAPTGLADNDRRHRRGLDDLIDILTDMPPQRRGLPLVITVGRLHPLKGVDRVVRAWAASDIARRTNMVVVGGDLANPNADELDVLTSLDDIVGDRSTASGVVLLGHRPHGDVARILAAAAIGVAPYIGAPGVYVCGAVKEEFGLAIVEALAAGLAVVAPQRGGPASYVDDRRTGRLVDTTSVDEIAAGLVDALALSGDRTTMRTAASTVLADLTIESMAARLVTLYSSAASMVRGGPIA